MKTTNWNTRNGIPFYKGIFSAPESFDRIFGDLLESSGVEISYGKFSAINVIESEHEYTIECMIPGFEKDEIKINMEEAGLLNVSAEKKAGVSAIEKNYTKREFKAEKFSRSFNLPDNINNEGIEAEYKNGVLHINLPKMTAEKRTNKEISIK